MQVNTFRITATIFLFCAVLAACGHSATKGKKVTPKQAIESFVSAGAGVQVSGGKVTIRIEKKTKKECGLGDCGIGYVRVGSLEYPLVYRHLNGRWFVDGIPLDQNLKPLFVKPAPRIVQNEQTKKPSQKIAKRPYTGDFGPAFLLNADYDESKMDIGFFCDVGYAYCDNLLRKLEDRNVNIFFWPVGVTAWNREADALVLSSPLHLRLKVFHALYASRDTLKKDGMLAWLQNEQQVFPQKELLERNRGLVKRQRKHALDGGVTHIPTLVLPHGKRLVGAVSEEDLDKAIADAKAGECKCHAPTVQNEHTSGSCGCKTVKSSPSASGVQNEHGKGSVENKGKTPNKGEKK